LFGVAYRLEQFGDKDAELKFAIFDDIYSYQDEAFMLARIILNKTNINNNTTLVIEDFEIGELYAKKEATFFMFEELTEVLKAMKIFQIEVSNQKVINKNKEGFVSSGFKQAPEGNLIKVL
jgi:hypothetical protein